MEAIILPAEEVLVVQVEVAQVECKPQVQPELQTQAVVAVEVAVEHHNNPEVPAAAVLSSSSI